MTEPWPIDFAAVARELELQAEQVASVTRLLDGGNTVPFITRYRKEQTGNLDEGAIRAIQQRVMSLRQLAERSQTILRLIDAQGKLTPELRRAIESADSLKRLEDLYLPFRPKRKSRALQARQRGLEPLADAIWNQDPGLGDLEQAALRFVAADRELPDTAAVLQGTLDLLSERIGDDAGTRAALRSVAWKTGQLVAARGKLDDKASEAFRDYFDHRESVAQIPPHRVLAINRGERLGALRVKFEWDDNQARARTHQALRLDGHRFREFFERCAADALTRHLEPSHQREVRRELTHRAETHAVDVFARNLRDLLLQPPVCGQRIVAVDPGFRTGCKLAALDEFGRCLATDTLYVTGSPEKRSASLSKLVEFVKAHDCRVIAVGNGTACRETEELVSEAIALQLPDVSYVIVNEAGASVYSTSLIAGEEFPEYDATVRGTISIGRRLQDPLSELVKIEPQHIGVGMYQHDVNPKRLQESLEEIVESCVNYVGVDVNTASTSLLKRVSGLNQLLARRIVDWREEHHRFTRRSELLDVPGIGAATFEQAAGFLKIAGGLEPLDATWIHPESYQAAVKLLERLGVTPEEWIEQPSAELRERLTQVDVDAFAREAQVGLPTARDIVESLLRPGRDPRVDLPGPLFKRGILKLEDLAEGMELAGTVLNVVDFGAFVDIGLKDSGLVHVSQMSTQYVRNPHDVASAGEIVKVWVLGIDHQRRRVSLTMVDPRQPRSRPAHPRREREPEPAGAQPEQPGVPVAPAPSPATRAAARPAGPSSAASPPAPASGAAEPLRGFDELKQLWDNRRPSRSK